MKRRARALLVAAALGLPLSVAVSCGTGGVVGGSCSAGLTECSGACVNLGSDPENCGSCGYACEQDEQCIVGVCIGTTVALCGGAPCPDAGLGNGGGGGGNGGGGNGGNGGGDGLDGGVCEPPYDTQEHCGDCDTSCVAPLPLCAPSGSSYACSEACDDGLIPCNGRCIDPLTNADHCGACDRRCPTAICRDGACVGGTAGHVVAACMNLDRFRSNAPQNTLLGNTIFLDGSDPVQVLGYVEYATARVVAGVERALVEADDQNGRSLERTLTSSPDEVIAALDSRSHDVLLVYDQGLAPAGYLATLGQSWSAPLNRFTRAGGIVIVLSSATGTSEMHDFLTEGGLVEGVTGATEATGTLLYNRAPSDAVGLNVFAEFRALTSSCLFGTNATPAPGTVFVVTDTAGGSGDALGAPAVIHRVVTP